MYNLSMTKVFSKKKASLLSIKVVKLKTLLIFKITIILFVINHLHFFIIIQIVDNVRNKCVYPDQCYCPLYDQFPANCSSITKAQNDTCGCPICGSIYYIK